MTHKTTLFTALAIVVAQAVSARISAAADDRLSITIDGSGPRVEVSPTLYGIFFEEINHAGEGGLYAEMVLNRDFEMNTLPAGATWAGNLLRTRQGWHERKWFGNALHGWTLAKQGAAKGSIRQDDRKPLNVYHPHSLRLTAREVRGRLGVVNGGFWGMNIQAGKWYDLSFYARTEGTDRFDLAVSLESGTGQPVYATADVKDVGGPWRQYRCGLHARAFDPAGRLVVAVDRPGTIWFDVVSLFPRDTFKGRPNGMRADVAGVLANLRPSFVRFPGGAVAGGLNLDNRFQWKRSIGDIARRRGTMNLWGYYSTYGLGFHEYLQWCEDMGADALYVCNPGMSDGYRNPEAAPPGEVGAYVQEALDALEYALGSAASKWGAQRVANGHPAPFPLRYIEIGNESGGERYLANYGRFYQAVHARYPAVTILGNQRGCAAAPIDIVDDHFYAGPDDLFALAAHYDAADRKGPKVYVGEYACSGDVGEGNLLVRWRKRPS